MEEGDKGGYFIMKKMFSKFEKMKLPLENEKVEQ